MDLKPHDLHLILDRMVRTGKLYDPTGKLVFSFESRNRTVNDSAPVNHRWGPCPPGEFLLGHPIRKGTVPFGPYFILLSDYGDHHTMQENGRSGIGLHAGGSGLKFPFEPHQGFTVTHGCWRLQNLSLLQLVHRVQIAQSDGGKVYATVVAPGPSSAQPSDEFEPDIIVDESTLDPDE